MSDKIVVPARFHGPDGSGNGGYVAGLLARQTVGPCEVTLRLPPPLEKPLDVRRGAAGVDLYDGASLVAQAIAADLGDVAMPEPVDVDTATAATAAYAGYLRHPFPRCFVCGPERPDGLRIFAGQVSGRDVVASPWTPAMEFADADGYVREEFVSAALDCPGAWSLEINPGRPLVLGRFAVRHDRRVVAGVPYVAIGWPLAVEGRKLFAATALLDAAGAPVAVAKATWIAIRTDDPELS
ncbi:MAG: hypothetical protein ABIM89_01780 [Mycobacteriales bacterium]